LFIHVSEGTKEAYRKNQIGRSTPHAVVRSGMPVERFQNAEMPDDWRNLLGLAAGEEKPRVILMMAALEARKRQIGFLNGFAAATAPGQPIKLVLAGEGPDRPMIEARVSSLGLADRVKLLGHYPEPDRLVRMADLGVLASVREGLPRVVIQYLAGGLPVVVSPIDGIEEVVHDGQNGRVVTASDAETVAAESVRVLLDTGEYARLAAGAGKSPVTEWSYESMHASLDAAYEHLPQFSAIMSRASSRDRMASSL
jgi:glycosyltransferase involved in cell wall biosynthesis